MARLRSVPADSLPQQRLVEWEATFEQIEGEICKKAHLLSCECDPAIS